MTRTGKHTLYFEVLEAFRASPACALCDLELRDVLRFLENILYAHVNDPGFRRRLRDTGGFCARHAHMLAGFRDGLGTAILFRDQAESAAELLARRRSPAAGLSILPRKRPPGRRPPCPACAIQEESRGRYSDTLLSWLDDAPLRRAFLDSPGPCLPHSIRLLDTAPTQEVRRFLAETSTRKFEKLRGELDEYIRSSAHGAPPPRESGAWKRAVTLSCGKEGVF